MPHSVLFNGIVDAIAQAVSALVQREAAADSSWSDARTDFISFGGADFRTVCRF